VLLNQVTRQFFYPRGHRARSYRPSRYNNIKETKPIPSIKYQFYRNTSHHMEGLGVSREPRPGLPLFRPRRNMANAWRSITAFFAKDGADCRRQ
jgi:hypothetical protein